MKQILFKTTLIIAAFCTAAFFTPLNAQTLLDVDGKLHVNAAGNVGVATTTPLYLLHVAKTATEPHITVHNTGSNGGATFRMIDNNSGADFKFKSIGIGDFKIRDQTNALDVIIIKGDGTGNVGVGVVQNTPITSKLDINGDLRIRTVTNDDLLDNVLVIDGTGTVHYRDASTIGGGARVMMKNVDDLKGIVDMQQNQLDDKTEQIRILESKLEALIIQMNQLELDLRHCCLAHQNGNVTGSNSTSDRAHLAQNIPNPFNQQTIIKYYLPKNSSQALIRISDMHGNLIRVDEISESGYGQITIEANILSPGTYLYELIVGSERIDTKRMVIQK